MMDHGRDAVGWPVVVGDRVTFWNRRACAGYKADTVGSGRVTKVTAQRVYVKTDQKTTVLRETSKVTKTFSQE